jgi:chemotaxis protein methyltransferase CheR
MGQVDQGELARLREQIAEYSGLDASVLSSDALQQAIGRRLAARALDRPEQYWPLLRSGENGEIGQLVQILTNKETFFFREEHHFEALNSQVLPALLGGDRPRRRLRVWSAGCATGEEPYSLAITLLEYRARHGFFEAEIVATDIDEATLEMARQGCYGSRSLRLVPDATRQRYFRSAGRADRVGEQRHCVLPAVANLVTFRVHNLAAEHHPTNLADFDLVFCRNVSIYFHPAARERLNARLAASLREGGYLFVASAETMGHNQGRLDLVSLDNTFLFHKAAAGSKTLAVRARQEASPGVRQASPGVSAAIPATSHRFRAAPLAEAGRSAAPPKAAPPPLGEALRAFQRHEFEVALAALDRLSSEERERPDVACLRAAILLQQERLPEAESLCEQVLAHNPWHTDAHFLLGLSFRQRGQADAAIQSLKQAIYLYPGHRDAHFFLAETYRGLGLEVQARREYENTLNILAAAAATQSGAQEEPVFHLTGLPDEALRQACQANLINLRPPEARRRNERGDRPLSQGRHGA